jgi:phosphoribosylformimino-5-aminoimidazole carboxamide ribotide isomerase
MRIIPVIDVTDGVVVRAVGGRRDEYRPLVSQLTDSTDPIEVAKALLEATGAQELYLADLDAIRNRVEVSPTVVDLLKAVTSTTWVDIGVMASRDLDLLPRLPHVRPVVASETVFRVETAWEAAAFSIDLSNGVIQGRWKKWGLESPRDVVGLARLLAEHDPPTLIVLELTGVGTQEGPQTVEACRQIRAAVPQAELITGGGVRDWDDVKRLEDAGADAVLVASALHDGRLKPRPR